MLCHHQITRQTAQILFRNSKKHRLLEILSRIKVGELIVRMGKLLLNTSNFKRILHFLPTTATMAMPFHRRIKKITTTTNLIHRIKVIAK